ncbi:DUF3560 domain-containing protein [Janibacter limosus]|uniref:DUF3560 domain-containing protein n=1 Tax=Janibacter limosus TaxID=53458 RepID=UPI000836D162|nr:DUF3560 domain-containing protein [Janibacter limosus]
MNTLTITHSPTEGTTIDGTEKGDGSAPALKSLGWRWGRTIGAWYVPHSRDKTPKMHVINPTTTALEAAGFIVTVILDITEPDPAEVEARKTQREAQRAEAMAAKAERKQATAEQAWTRADAAHEALPPFGEPVKVGHHSENRHRRAHDRAWSTFGQAVEADRVAEQATRSAATAARATTARHNPITVANRIAKLASEIRKIESTLAGGPAWRKDNEGAGYHLEHVQPHGEHRDQLEATRDARARDLEFWQTVRDEQITAGEATNYGPTTVSKGDAVKIRGQWRRVARANTKSVSVETGYSWTDRTPWHEVQDHRPAT